MKLQSIAASVLFASSTLGAVVKRQAQFAQGQPIDGKGKGAPILGTSRRIPDYDLQRLTTGARWYGPSD
tara:strand:- start:3886 stop:4092 length:207 start_codon:yes stop_codon:yes gene_type:complete